MMLLEIALFSAFCVFLGVVFVRVFDWSQDVLYGPYVRRETK
jgi:hypothetical protein